MLELIPWRERRELDRFRREMDRLFDEFFEMRPLRRLFGEGEWIPSVDLSENPKEIVVHAEVPGIDPKDIDITIHGRTLTLKGEKKSEKEEKDVNYHRIERRYGSFTRTLELPTDVDPDNAKATYKDGVLKLVIPKTKEQAVKKIEVKSG